MGSGGRVGGKGREGKEGGKRRGGEGKGTVERE